MFTNNYYDKDEPGGGSGGQGGGPAGGSPVQQPKTYSEDEFKKVVEQRQTLKTEIEELKNKLRDFEESDAKRKGDLETIINQKKDELEKLKTELNEHKSKSEQWEKYKETRINAAKQKLGDKWKDSFSNLPLEDLEELINTVISPKVPDVDGGGNPPPKVEITDAEKAEAKKMGLTEEGFLQYKKTREKLKKN